MDVLGKAEQDLLAGKITWAEFEELINPSVKVPLTAAERKRKQRAKTVRPGKRGKDRKPRKAKELAIDKTWDGFLAALATPVIRFDAFIGCVVRGDTLRSDGEDMEQIK